MDKIKECKIHWMTEYRMRSDWRYRCKKCAVDSVTKKRRMLKQKSVEYLWWQCSVCWYNKCIWALEFHHKDDKWFGISASWFTRSWESLKKELDKCVLICANCHREEHSMSFISNGG